MARPSDYTEETADEVCAELMRGRSLRSICGDEGMPDRATIHRWLSAHEGFATKYARARDIQADHLFDEMQEIADSGNADDVQRARLRVTTMQWRASKLAPKKYGDKIAHVGGNDDDAPIKTKVDLSGLSVEQLTALAAIPG
jgi:hypothetical protein